MPRTWEQFEDKDKSNSPRAKNLTCILRTEVSVTEPLTETEHRLVSDGKNCGLNFNLNMNNLVL